MYFENNEKNIYVAYYEYSHSFPPHFQNKIEIAHCFSGQQKIKIAGEIYTLNKGDSVFIAPNLIHEYIETESQSSKTEVLCLMSDIDVFHQLLPQLTSKVPLSAFVPANLTDKTTLNAFRQMTEAKNNNLELLGWACIALSGIIKNLEFGENNKTFNTKLIQMLISYINENFKEDLTLETIASHFGYSTSYIAHIFSEQLKIPFRSYLGSTRSEHARKLILEKNKTLTEICYECGFNSPNTFCRNFKKHFGKTPSEFKKETFTVSI